MKKILCLVLVLALAVVLASCVGDKTTTTTTTTTAKPNGGTDVHEKGEGVMTYLEYMEAELDTEVVVECFVQGHQAWWFDSDEGHGKISVYAQDIDGGYFMYEMACSEEDAARLTEGTKIRVTGYKSAWADEVEIIDCTFEILEGNYVAGWIDMSTLLDGEDYIDYQNMKVFFPECEVVSIEYQNGAPGKDIYVKVLFEGTELDFCVESYLVAPDTELYQSFAELKAGDVIDVKGFLYWYNGVNTHITGIEAIEAK